MAKIKQLSNLTIYLSIILSLTLTSSYGQHIQIGMDIDGEAASDLSGASVSLSSDGSIVAIGASLNDGNGNNTGHVRVYQHNTSTDIWEQLGQDIDGEAASDLSGASVSLSSDGNIVAVGAYSNDGNGNDSGHVRVYQYNTSTDIWEQLGQDIDGEAANDYSGSNISLSADGSRVAIGAFDNDGVNGTDSGHVRVYQFNSGSSLWEQIGQDIDGEATGDASGHSLSLSLDGSRVAIGAFLNDGVGVIDSGHVRVYQFNSGINLWEQIGQDIDSEAELDRSGASVSLSLDGNKVAVGAPHNDGNGDNSGHVRVYQYNSSISLWEQIGQDIDGEATGDNSGGYSELSLSSDGNKVAIGAAHNDDNGNDSGHVRIYQHNPSTDLWELIEQDIEGEAELDRSGETVSLSSDGSRVAIGAPHNNGINGSDSGHVRVYEVVEVVLSSTTNEFINFKLYPNPVSEVLYVTITATTDKLKHFKLYNILGQLVKETQKPQLDVSNLQNGIYFIEITTNKGIKANKKLIKN